MTKRKRIKRQTLHKQEMCASQNMPGYINYQMLNNSIYSNGDLDL